MEPQRMDVCRYMDQLVEELCRRAPKALKKWDQDAIHDARVATRRLKAMVNLLTPLTQEEYRRPFARALRSLRRRLGPLRDLDVMIDHLQESCYQRRHATAAAWVTHRLQEERRVQRHKLATKASPAGILARLGTWWGLREEVGDLLERTPLDGHLARALRQQLESFTLHADKLRANMDLHARERAPDDPHALRIAGKLLRYTLELAATLGHPLPPAVLAHFKQMQDTLGLWHDCVVLSQKVMRLTLDDEIACHDRALYEQLLHLSGLLWRQAEHQLKRFAAIWSARGPELTTTIQTLFPLPALNPGLVPVGMGPGAAPATAA